MDLPGDQLKQDGPETVKSIGVGEDQRLHAVSRTEFFVGDESE